MKVWTALSESDLYDIADEIGVSLSDRGTVYDHRVPLTRVGRAYSFGLRPQRATKDENGKGTGYRYQRTSASWHNDNRRVFAVCWHGHRDFMREIFKHDPDARIKTMWADYKGTENFEATYPDTGYRNVGAPIFPRYAAEICTCGEGVW